MSKYLEYKQKLKQAPPIDHPYLDAILRCIMDLEDRIENDNVLMLGRMDIEKLIELVDKATPIIPIFKKSNYLRYCAHCEEPVFEIDKFCWNCGQAIDWSEDE